MVKKIHIVRKSRRRSRRRSPRKSKKNKKSNRRSRRKSNTKKLKGGTDSSQVPLIPPPPYKSKDDVERERRDDEALANIALDTQREDILMKHRKREKAIAEAAAQHTPKPPPGPVSAAAVNVEEWILKEYLIPHVGGKPKVLHQKSFTLTTKIQEKILKKFTSNRE